MYDCKINGMDNRFIQDIALSSPFFDLCTASSLHTLSLEWAIKLK